ncbi:RNA polymerase-associated protein LEO1-like [Meriones unguiculatus]|uniref:RNA polymerase-associated protein LEO1-like n=1 Tax=Meriones unguiculatus TaxID=10047 RepID=UPI00293ECB01|nr:RNA polymerase-associated protein LEO1-like [Meriones unguiculatus]
MDLFGDINDISSGSDEDQRGPSPRQPATCLCHIRRQSPAGPRGEPPNQRVGRRVSETRIKIEIPSINSDLGNELFFVKLPKFLRIEPKPFDPQLYEDECGNEKVLYEEDKTRLKIKVENTIRWRVCQDEEGYKMKESNTRVVKWSDGSMSLHIGNEVFDVHKVPLQDNHNQLFVREDTGLRGQAIFNSRLTFRPHCTDSAAYKKMTLSFGNRSPKTQIRILPMAGRDPECSRADLIKVQKRECLRASIRRSVRLPRKKWGPAPCFTIREPDDDDKEEKWGEEEEKAEDKEGQASGLVTTKNHCRGAAHKKRAVSFSYCNHEGSEDDKARGLLKAKKPVMDRGYKPSRKRPRDEEED